MNLSGIMTNNIYLGYNILTKLKIWVGLCALLASLQVYGNEITIQDAWLRPIASGQDDAMVGMTINSAKHARIIGVISSYYMSVAMQGPAKAGTTKSKEVEFIDLPAQKSVVLSAESVHLLLTGSRKNISLTNKVPLTLSVQFDDGSTRNITAIAVTPFSKSDVAAPVPAQAGVVEDKVVAPPPAPVKAKEIVEEKPKPVAAPKKPVDVKPAKAAPVAEVKEPSRAAVVVPVPVVVAAPIPAPVVVAAPAPVAPVVKPAEQPKQDDARANAECSTLARELKECEKGNEMMQEWCVTNVRTKYACQLTTEQMKKLK
jgi:copper(I)-binding protein